MAIKTLVSLLVVGHNQREYIGAAIEGAFQQTYHPLEIIFSDDGSTDGTFEIMSAMATAYIGPHTVRAHQWSPNSGTLGNHLNRLMPMANGELIVIASGDDVSLPERVERLVEVWHSCGQPVGSIFSGAYQTDQNLSITRSTSPEPWVDNRINELIQGECFSIVGCAHAWHRDVFTYFGPLAPNVVNEDPAITFRSALLDGVFTFSDTLVLHRLHLSNSGSAGQNNLSSCIEVREALRIALTRRIALVQSIRTDIASFERQGPAGKNVGRSRRITTEELRKTCDNVDRYCHTTLDLMDRSFVFRKIGLIKQYCRLLAHDRGAASTLLKYLIAPQLWLAFRRFRNLVRRQVKAH